jgi:hypothetical protein
VPFVLVPRHILDVHGGKKPLSLLIHLQQAQEAFVFRAPLAALAFMRFILEVVLIGLSLSETLYGWLAG